MAFIHACNIHASARQNVTMALSSGGHAGLLHALAGCMTIDVSAEIHIGFTMSWSWMLCGGWTFETLLSAMVM